MAGGVIGALRVTLGLSTAAFETGLKKARGGLSSFASFAKSAGMVAGAALVAMATGVGLALKGMLEKADQMGKMAQSVGVPVEELSRLAYAAELSDISIEQLGTALKKQSRGMSDAAGGTGAAADAYERLGVAVTNSDGTLRSNTDVMADVADRFAGMEDGAQKTALAMQIFGKSGADMIPLLNGGSAGLREMMEEAEALGLTIDAKTAAAAERFNDNLTRLKSVGQGVTTQLAASMAPIMATVSDLFVKMAKNGALMNAAGTALGFTFKALVSVLLVVIGTISIGVTRLTSFAKAFMAAAKGDFAGAWAELRKGATSSKAIFDSTIGQIPAVWRGAGSEAAAMAPRVGTQLAAPLEDAAGKAKKAKDEIAEAAREAARQQEEAARVIEGLAGKGEKAARQYSENLAILRRELDAGRLSLDDYEQALERLNLEFEANRGEFEPADIELNPVLTSPGEIQEVNAGIQASAEEARTAFGQAFSDAVLALTEGRWTDLLAEWVRGWAQRGLDDLGAQLYDLFKGMGGWSGIGAMVSNAFGGGIKLPGFDNGADFIVNGAAGIDRNLVAFRASRGERVRVETPEQQRANGARGLTIVQNFPNTDNPAAWAYSGRQAARRMKRALG